MEKVQFNDLNSQHRSYHKEFKKAFEKLLTKGTFILGGEVSSFEEEFAKYIGLKFGVGVASGTDALILALMALNLEPEDEVAIPVNVYPVAFAVASAGFKIRLVDIGSNSFNLTLEELQKKLTQKTKVIILVHLFGQTANVKGITDFARRHGIKVIEDCSQAHGTLYQGKRVGSFGDISCFSFYPTKNLGALGDGGIVLTNNQFIADKIRGLRQYGEIKRYQSKFLGRISRLDELQAVFLRIKLKKLDQVVKNRIEKANLYIKNLTGLDEITLPLSTQRMEHTYHLFVIKTKRRDALKKYLEKKGIQTAIHYPQLISEVPTFSYLQNKAEDFPNAVTANHQILSLPFYPNMKDSQIKYVCDTIRKYF